MKLSPILKWAGGKEQELKFIHPELPSEFTNYYEPFLGGGAVYFSISSKNAFINDLSWELIDLYNNIKSQNKEFFCFIEKIIYAWQNIETIVHNHTEFITKFYMLYRDNKIDEINLSSWINDFISKNNMLFMNIINGYLEFNPKAFFKELHKNLHSKISRMKKIEVQKHIMPIQDILDNFECALKSAFYMYIRYLYNNYNKYNMRESEFSALFFFIRNFAYSGMFRYNKDGQFNVPYGGIGYNRKDLSKKISYLKSESLVNHLASANTYNLDFEEFFKVNKPNENDFVFLDPPYDSEFSTYAQNEFTKEDQIRLANYLINNCQAKWMMIIKNTEFIYGLYNKEGININSFEKKYLVSFQNRNNKNAEHLIIKNY